MNMHPDRVEQHVSPKDLDLLPSPVLSAEIDGWSVIVPGLPLYGDGPTPALALCDAVAALREYAVDWDQRLRAAPNHEQNRPVVDVVDRCTDRQLINWLSGGADGYAGQ